MNRIRDQRLRYGPPMRREGRGEPHPAIVERVVWLEELVRVFGPHEVADWEEPPVGWKFTDWCGRRRPDDRDWTGRDRATA